VRIRTNTASSTKTSMASAVTPVAVIELGTSSIRMVIAQLRNRNRFEVLDSLQMAVAVGKDTFTQNRIEPDTTEECVRVLRLFGQKLQEYNIVKSDQITAVATSAVREAANRETFLDRILVATGFSIRAIDQAEVNRYIYQAVRPSLISEDFWKKEDVLVIEVGGGSTEALLFRRGRVSNSHLYRLGSLRLHQTIEQLRAPGVRAVEIMRIQVRQTVEQILESIAPVKKLRLVALGGDARFACTRLKAKWNTKGLARLPKELLSRFTEKVLMKSTDELVRRHQITYPDAETLGPALLIYDYLAAELGLQELLVGEANVRNGILVEMASGGSRTSDFKKQIIHSAQALGRRYAVDAAHARYVAEISGRIFQLMQPAHRLSSRDELILHVSALLHETGVYVNRSSHHKHSFYIILNSGLFGLGSEELLIAALTARYHRRALPQTDHEYYGTLPMEMRIKVLKLASILRIADALDMQHTQKLSDPLFSLENGNLIITAVGAGNLDLEQHRLKEKSNLFTQVYGLGIQLQGS